MKDMTIIKWLQSTSAFDQHFTRLYLLLYLSFCPSFLLPTIYMIRSFLILRLLLPVQSNWCHIRLWKRCFFAWATFMRFQFIHHLHVVIILEILDWLGGWINNSWAPPGRGHFEIRRFNQLPSLFLLVLGYEGVHYVIQIMIVVVSSIEMVSFGLLGGFRTILNISDNSLNKVCN